MHNAFCDVNGGGAVNDAVNDAVNVFVPPKLSAQVCFSVRKDGNDEDTLVTSEDT